MPNQRAPILCILREPNKKQCRSINNNKVKNIAYADDKNEEMNEVMPENAPTIVVVPV